MQQTPTKPATPAQIALTALVLTLGTVAMAHAQGADPLGVSTIKDAVVATFKVLAGIGIVFGFLRMMTGRHTMEGLVTIRTGPAFLAARRWPAVFKLNTSCRCRCTARMRQKLGCGPRRPTC